MVNTEEIEQALAGGGFLSRLDAPDLAAILAEMRIQTFEANEVIIAADDPVGSVYVLFEGAAVVALYSEDGKVVTYRDIVPGDVFGELSAIDGQPRSAFVTARQHVRLGALEPRQLDALMDGSRGIARAVMRHLTEQVRRMTDRLFEYRTLLVRERLIHELVRRGRAVDPDAETVLIPVPPTHFELATHIGTHREAVTKELSQLTQAGLIAKAGRGLELPSIPRLLEEARTRLR